MHAWLSSAIDMSGSSCTVRSSLSFCSISANLLVHNTSVAASDSAMSFASLEVWATTNCCFEPPLIGPITNFSLGPVLDLREVTSVPSLSPKTFERHPFTCLVEHSQAFRILYISRNVLARSLYIDRRRLKSARNVLGCVRNVLSDCFREKA